MPTTHENYTLNIQPVDDHLEVFIPELGMKVTTTSASRDCGIPAQDAREPGKGELTGPLQSDTCKNLAIAAHHHGEASGLFMAVRVAL
jgi:hypothetical protein